MAAQSAPATSPRFPTSRLAKILARPMTDKRSRDGVLVIDKPVGPTSHRIVQTVRRQLQSKVGHTGTLDPLASGVLPLVLGRATRLARFFQSHDKEYVAEVQLGRTTDTYDREGTVLQERPVPPLTREEVRGLLDRFQGTLKQLPPMYSAIKVGGRKLYELARKNEEQPRPLRTVSIYRIDLLDNQPDIWKLRVHCSSGTYIRSRKNEEQPRPLRTVSIYRIDLLDNQPDIWKLRVHCSSGTYIRSLAYDLGETIGCGAHLANLRRTRAGIFQLERSTSIERLEPDWELAFHPMEQLFPEMPQIELDLIRANRVRHGGEILAEADAEDGWCLLLHEGRLVAVGKVERQRIQPVIVLEAL